MGASPSGRWSHLQARGGHSTCRAAPPLVLVALATGPQGAGARPRTAIDQAGPLELVRGSVPRVLAIVQAPRVVARGDAQRAAEIRRVAQGLFDFDEREEFVVLFTITFVGESIGDPYAQVRSRIATNRLKFPIDCRLRMRDGHWGLALPRTRQIETHAIPRTGRGARQDTDRGRGLAGVGAVYELYKK